MTIIPTRKGAKVLFGGEEMIVVGQNGFDELTLKSKKDGQYFHAPMDHLLREAEGKAPAIVKVDQIRLSKVQAYKNAFEPLLTLPRRTKDAVKAAAEKIGISVAGAYYALARYDLSHDLNDLPPPTRSGGRGKPRINPKAEQIIQETLEEILLTRRQQEPAEFYRVAERKLKKVGFQVAVSTLRDRVAKIPEHKWKERRQGYDAAKKDKAHRDYAPTGSRPLETIQIDHWKADIEILSDDRLTIIGRPWITLAIDLYTRVIWGWYISLDAPCFESVGYCMIHGMTRKESYLQSLGLKADMPFWGDPEALHLDNANEFKGYSLGWSCDQYNIKLDWRPVKSPQYGCHIERLNKTLALKFKSLPGGTGSNPSERKKFRPEVTAAFTWHDLEKQVAMLINEYHHTPHLGIDGETPHNKWTNYYFGPSGQRHPLPAIRVDDHALRLNWYPLKHPAPSIQAYGIQNLYLPYYGPEIEFLVRDHKGEKVEVKPDPRDVRRIWVLHPVRNEWIEVPCRMTSFPAAALWELRAARKEAHRLGRKPTPELLAQLIEQRRAHQAEAEKLTKTAQREVTKRSRDQDMRQRTQRVLKDVADDGQIELVKPPLDPKPPRVRQSGNHPHGNIDSAALAAAMEKAAALSDADIDSYLNDM